MVMAGLTAATGAKTSNFAMKICPVVKTLAAILFFAGSIWEVITGKRDRSVHHGCPTNMLNTLDMSRQRLGL